MTDDFSKSMFSKLNLEKKLQDWKSNFKDEESKLKISLEAIEDSIKQSLENEPNEDGGERVVAYKLTNGQFITLFHKINHKKVLPDKITLSVDEITKPQLKEKYEELDLEEIEESKLYYECFQDNLKHNCVTDEIILKILQRQPKNYNPNEVYDAPGFVTECPQEIEELMVQYNIFKEKLKLLRKHKRDGVKKVQTEINEHDSIIASNMQNPKERVTVVPDDIDESLVNEIVAKPFLPSLPAIADNEDEIYFQSSPPQLPLSASHQPPQQTTALQPQSSPPTHQPPTNRELKRKSTSPPPPDFEEDDASMAQSSTIIPHKKIKTVQAFDVQKIPKTKRKSVSPELSQYLKNVNKSLKYDDDVVVTSKKEAGSSFNIKTKQKLVKTFLDVYDHYVENQKKKSKDDESEVVDFKIKINKKV